MKAYTLRASVLNLTMAQWKTYKTLEDNEGNITITVPAALKLFGALSTLSAKTNTQEREFISCLYEKFRCTELL